MPVQTIADIERDPHWQARQLTFDFADEAGTVRMHNVFPRFAETPGTVQWGGRVAVGADNEAVYGSELGLTHDELERLKGDGIL